MKHGWIRSYGVGAALGLAALAGAPDAVAQIARPTDAADLIAMTGETEFQKKPSHRAFVFAAMDYALVAETGAAQTPYSDAINTWFLDYVSPARENQIFATLMQASVINAPIDIYMLMGQSNMSGLTEGTGWQGPDDEIRELIQAETPDRTVVTLNCSWPATPMNAWDPAKLWFAGGAQGLFYNCVEWVRQLENAQGSRGRVRGFFFYQGEADVLWEMQYPGSFVSTWPEKYLRLVEALRDQFGDAPAVHAQLATHGSTDPDHVAAWQAMKDAQAGVQVEYGSMIVTDDLTTHDGVHLDDCSQACAGERFATEMLALQGRPTPAGAYCPGVSTCWASP